MNTTAWSTVAQKKTTNLGSVWTTMNWVPMIPARKPTNVFASPPIPITLLDNARVTVDNQRATLGALQNSLEDTISNLNTESVNMQAAKSAILDTNIATETVNFTKYQVLQLASTAVLAQANVQASSALSLLR